MVVDHQARGGTGIKLLRELKVGQVVYCIHLEGLERFRSANCRVDGTRIPSKDGDPMVEVSKTCARYAASRELDNLLT